MTPRTEALILDGVACYRITRLITKDRLFVNVRDNIIRNAYKATDTPFNASQVVAPGDWVTLAVADPDAPATATLVTCRMCASIWVATGVILARGVAPKQWDPIAQMLTIASVGALIAGLEQ